MAYFNKTHERSEYPIQDILDSGNKELIKRFQYTKEVLNEMAKAHEYKKEADDPKGQYRGRSPEKDIFNHTNQTPIKLSTTQSEIRIGKFNETTLFK